MYGAAASLEKGQLPVLCLDTFAGTGIDYIIESSFTDMILGPDITTKDLAVGQPRTAMFIVNCDDISNPIDIRQPRNTLSAFPHILKLTY